VIHPSDGRRRALSRSSFVLRTSYFVLPLVLAVLLSACSFTTDTIATVGGTRITRGELNAELQALPAQSRNSGQTLDWMIFYRLMELEAQAQKITITEDEITARNNADIASIKQQFPSGTVTPSDIFQQELLSQGIAGSSAYRESLREQLLVEKLRPFWYKSPVDMVTIRLLVVESQDKGVEAAQKGRSGTSFDDLVKAYAGITYQDPSVVDSFGSRPADVLGTQVKSAFKQIKQGEYSDPVQVSAGQYIVLYISKLENRAPTAQEESYLVSPWVDTLRAKYKVTVDPSLNLPSLNTP
jgi:parvulin-like peptidyl-prolyl isomerase